MKKNFFCFLFFFTFWAVAVGAIPDPNTFSVIWSGTQTNYPASQFDATMAALNSATACNVTVVLGSGTFSTGGNVFWQDPNYGYWPIGSQIQSAGYWGYLDNWKIVGQGKFKTTLKHKNVGFPDGWSPASPTSANLAGAVIGPYITSYAELQTGLPVNIVNGPIIQGIGIDVGASYQTSGTAQNMGAIRAIGPNSVVRDVTAWNYGSTKIGYECFVIANGPVYNVNGTNPQPLFNNTFEDIVVGQPTAITHKDGLTFLSVTGSNAWVRSLYNHAATTGTGAGFATYFQTIELPWASNIEVTGCDIGNGNNFVYMDSYVSAKNLLIHHNKLGGVICALMLNGATVSDSFLTDNEILLTDNTNPNAAVVFYSGTSSNVVVSRNHIRLAPGASGASIAALRIAGGCTGLSITDNIIDLPTTTPIAITSSSQLSKVSGNHTSSGAPIGVAPAYWKYFPFIPWALSVINSQVTITGYSGSSTEVVVPDTVNNMPVAHIESSAFLNCTSMASVMIPGSVTSIGANAFFGCTSLTSIFFMGSAPTIGVNAFLDTPGALTVYYFNGQSGFFSPTWTDSSGDSFPAIAMGPFSPVVSWLLTNGFAYNSNLNLAPNGDGVSLLMAYALNLDPTRNQSGNVPTPTVVGNQIVLTFYAGNAGVTYAVESSSDLQAWSTAGVTLSTPDVYSFRTASVPITGTNCFMRLKMVY